MPADATSETARAARAALELPVHRAGVAHEVGARPRVTDEEFERKQAALQLVAALAGRHEVARRVVSAPRERDDMVQRRVVES